MITEMDHFSRGWQKLVALFPCFISFSFSTKRGSCPHLNNVPRPSAVLKEAVVGRRRDLFDALPVGHGVGRWAMTFLHEKGPRSRGEGSVREKVHALPIRVLGWEVKLENAFLE